MQVTERLYNGKPAKVETDLYSWFWGQDGYVIEKSTNRAIYQMAYIRTDRFGSDDITDPVVIASVREFLKALRAEQQRAEVDYERQQSAKYAAERADACASDDPRKASAYDNLQNEGYSDGYNPYRNGGVA